MATITAPAGTPTITIAGDLTSTTAPDAKVALTSAVERIEMPGAVTRTIRVDLKRARMVDSVGLNLLVGIIKRAKAAGGAVEILITETSVERILNFTRINQIAKVVREA